MPEQCSVLQPAAKSFEIQPSPALLPSAPPPAPPLTPQSVLQHNRKKPKNCSKGSKQGILLFNYLSSKPALGVRDLAVNPAMPYYCMSRDED